MLRTIATASLMLVFALRFLSGADPKFVYPLPASSDIDIRKSVPYKKVNGADLVMDIYRPAKRAPADRFPVVVFMNGYGDSPQRDWAQYTGWASLAAANGFIAINPDTHQAGIEEDFDSIVDYLRTHAAELQADAEQVGLYACSGHVVRTFSLVEDPKRTSVKSAVIYYGDAAVSTWRLDLPVLLVRAGLDRPGLNQRLEALGASALRANAPLTVLNHPGGHHGFEVIDDNAATRDVIAQTLRFFKTTLTREFQAGMRAGFDEATAAGAVSRDDFDTAARIYAALASAKASDSRLQLAYGEALLGAKRYMDAVAQFDKLRGNRQLGYRDLGLPAAMASALAGESDKAIEWLRSIPARFLPATIAEDPAFDSVRGNPEFQAVLARPKN